MMRFRRGVAALVIATLVHGGCASLLSPTLPQHTPRSAIVMSEAQMQDCLRPSVGRGGVGYTRLEPPVEDPELLIHLAGIPKEVRRIAQAAGLEGVLGALLREETVTSGERSLELLAMRLQVVTRISSLEIELTSLVFEADCTGNQMEAVIAELERRARKQELALTIASIGVGALVGIAAGLWDLRDPESKGPPALSIVAGGSTAALGLAAFVPKRGRVLFTHPRNPFVPIITGEDPDRLYPTFVFRLLLSPRADGTTPREAVLRDWQQIVHGSLPQDEREKAKTILFGKGGVYDGRLLDVRERMYDALESQLNAFAQDLEVLYRFVGRLLDDPELTMPEAEKPG